MREFSFRLPLPLKSKARPRFGKGRSFMPKDYMDWKNAARDHLKQYWVDFDLPTLEHFELRVEAHGPGRCDADNLIGSLLDSGLPDKKTGWAGAWKDDRVTVIPYISFRWVRDKEQYWDITITCID